MLRIRRIEHKTYFYTEDITQIRRLLLELDLMANNWTEPVDGTNGVYISFSERISDDTKKHIQKTFIDRSKPKRIDTIKGFKGCLVTGINLEFI